MVGACLSTPADSRGLHRITRPPGAGPPAHVYDVLLVTPPDVMADDDLAMHPPVGDPPFELGRQLSIVHIESSTAELVMNACDQRGHFHFGERQFGCLYAFVLDQPTAVAGYSRWDPDGTIMAAIALSRLVRDNAASTEYAARVTEFEGGEMSVFPYDGVESRHVYRLSDDREWLDADEAQQLAALLSRFWALGELHGRLRNALWTTEHTAWEYYLDIVLPALVSALEGLVNTSKSQVMKQFTTRVPALARELDIQGVSKTFCRKMYEARSQGAHGSDIDMFAAGADRAAAVAKVALLQEVLRRAVRRGIEDAQFRAVFDHDDSIRARWPVMVRHPRWRWRRQSL